MSQEKIQLEPLQEHEKPTLVIEEVDANVFAIIGAVSKALKRAGYSEYANEFRTLAMQSGSYDEVLQLTFRYIDWE